MHLGQKLDSLICKIPLQNLAVVQVVRSGRSYVSRLFKKWLIAATYNIQLEIDHTQGSCNKAADLLSRLYLDKTLYLTLLKELESSCLWHRILIQFLNLNYDIQFQVHPPPVLCYKKPGSGLIMHTDFPLRQPIHYILELILYSYFLWTFF